MTLAVSAPHPLATVAAVLSLILLVATELGIVQARRMTAMRTALVTGSVSENIVQRNAAIAAIIRAALVLGYIVLLVITLLLAGSR